MTEKLLMRQGREFLRLKYKQRLTRCEPARHGVRRWRLLGITPGGHRDPGQVAHRSDVLRLEVMVVEERPIVRNVVVRMGDEAAELSLLEGDDLVPSGAPVTPHDHAMRGRSVKRITGRRRPRVSQCCHLAAHGPSSVVDDNECAVAHDTPRYGRLLSRAPAAYVAKASNAPTPNPTVITSAAIAAS